MLLGPGLAVLGAAVAVFYDLRYGRIPNKLVYPMVLLSFPLAVYQGSAPAWLLNLTASSLVFYLFWELRVWGGGDAKLMIAVAALVPVYPETALLPSPEYGGFFFLSVVFNLLLLYLGRVSLLLLRRPDTRLRVLSSAGCALLFLPFLPIASFICFALDVYCSASGKTAEEARMSPMILAALLLSILAGDPLQLLF